MAIQCKKKAPHRTRFLYFCFIYRPRFIVPTRMNYYNISNIFMTQFADDQHWGRIFIPFAMFALPRINRSHSVNQSLKDWLTLTNWTLWVKVANSCWQSGCLIYGHLFPLHKVTSKRPYQHLRLAMDRELSGWIERDGRQLGMDGVVERHILLALLKIMLRSMECPLFLLSRWCLLPISLPFRLNDCLSQRTPSVVPCSPLFSYNNKNGEKKKSEYLSRRILYCC